MVRIVMVILLPVASPPHSKTKKEKLDNHAPGNQVLSLPRAASIHYLKSQQHRQSNAKSYPRRICIAISEAKGIYLKDVGTNPKDLTAVVTSSEICPEIRNKLTIFFN